MFYASQAGMYEVISCESDSVPGWASGANGAAPSSKREISASAEDLFLLTEVAVLLTAVPEPGSEVTESPPVLGRLGAAEEPGQHD